MPSTAQLLTAYRKELTQAGLHPELVDDMVKDAARTIVANEGLNVLSSTPIRLVICALTHSQAKEWVAKHNLLPQQVVMADQAETLQGLTDFAVVTLPGFETRIDAPRITLALSALQRGEDFAYQHANPDMISTTRERF